MYNSMEIESSNLNFRQSDERRFNSGFRASVVITVIAVIGLVTLFSFGHPREKLKNQLSSYVETKLTNDIHFGRFAAVNEFPYAVYLGCSGSLLSPNWVLTAEHCHLVVAGWNLYFGNIAPEQGTKRVVDKAYVHSTADLRLAHFATPLNIDSSIDIVPYLFSSSNQEPADGTLVTFAGWGCDENGNYGNLKAATAAINSNCDVSWWANSLCSHITHPDTTGSGCFGDSGGPMVVNVGGHTVQWGVSTNADAQLTRFENLATKYDWIQTTIAKEPVSLPVSISTSSSSVGTFYIINKRSNKALYMHDSSSGQQLTQFLFNSNSRQRFELISEKQLGGGWYFVKCVDSGLYWDIEANSVSNNAKLIQYTKKSSNSYNQLFRFQMENDQYFRITNRKSGKVVDVRYRSTADLAPIIQYDWLSQANQLFRLQRV